MNILEAIHYLWLDILIELGILKKEKINKNKVGLYNKFKATRTDGTSNPGEKHHDCTYFVLDLTHDEHAIPAIKSYIESCKEEFPLVAKDLTTRLERIALSKEVDNLIVEAKHSAKLWIELVN
jgi:hypothetical protein